MKHKKILIIYTGGTIGMCPTTEGYQPKPGWLTQAFNNIGSLKSEKMPSWEVLEYDPLIDSASATPETWQKLADTIKENYAAYDGFLVLHGTDTMTYSASAVSFLLENLAKPVFFTGSQVPLSEIRSDARSNVINSLYIMAHFDVPEVCVYFENKLLRGNRAVKMSASRYNAFESPNYPALAKIGIDATMREQKILPKPKGELIARQLKKNIHIASIRLFPGIDIDILQNLLAKPIQALVIESYGAGNAPTNRQDLYDILIAADKAGVLVVNCTQCVHGTVDMETYVTGHALAATGVVGVKDMTIEATLTKLYYLLSQELPLDQLRELMVADLRGEIS